MNHPIKYRKEDKPMSKGIIPRLEKLEKKVENLEKQLNAIFMPSPAPATPPPQPQPPQQQQAQQPPRRPPAQQQTPLT
jgi:hypothetical protein